MSHHKFHFVSCTQCQGKLHESETTSKYKCYNHCGHIILQLYSVNTSMYLNILLPQHLFCWKVLYGSIPFHHHLVVQMILCINKSIKRYTFLYIKLWQLIEWHSAFPMHTCIIYDYNYMHKCSYSYLFVCS